jgi:uncharacterized protein GlcG (DUF336 family)
VEVREGEEAMSMRERRRRGQVQTALARRSIRPALEQLEDRCVPSASSVLSNGLLTVTGDATMPVERILVSHDASANQIVVSDNGQMVGLFASASVAMIDVNAQARYSIVRVDPAVTQPANLTGGPGTNLQFAGGGPTTLTAGPGLNRQTAGASTDLIDASEGKGGTAVAGSGNTTIITSPGPGPEFIFGAKDKSVVLNADPPTTVDLRGAATPPNLSNFLGLQPSPNGTLSAADVGTLLQRAAAADGNDNAIVAIVDRGGRILGVRVEGNVSPAITGNTEKLVYSIDGAVALARTAAMFANNQAPLTSRTIQFISQSTVVQREVESDPTITDPNSTLAGPGFVAPIGIGGHFPPGVPFTPQVDLFGIENTNRDTTLHPGPNGTTVALPERFNINPAFIPAQIPPNESLAPPDSYGFVSGLEPNARPRGIGTLPGGIPIIQNGVLVGGIGVFFPGTTGFADAENSSLQSNFDPSKPDLSVEAEFDAFAAVGGSAQAGFPIGSLSGVAPVAGVSLPFGRIDLVGITLPLFGPGNATDGPANLVNVGKVLPPGNPNSGTNMPLLQPGANGMVTPGVSPLAPNNLLNGTLVPEGFLVTPHNGVGITAAHVQTIIAQGVQQATETRAAIRLPLDSQTRMTIAVADETGEIVGLFRMPDSTTFSIDVAVAKARNVAYYANPAQLQPEDQLPGVPAGTAFTNRTFRYLALPFFPEGINGAPPGPFSILNDPGTNPNNGLNTGAPEPASAFQSEFGHDAFNPQTNFHDPYNILNQNGIVFFPGSAPVYSGEVLIGGLGVSGDGVDQDDVVTFAAKQGFLNPSDVLTADEVTFNGIRLPFQKFNRQPLLSE